MTTGPLRFNTVEATFGTPSDSSRMVATGEGPMGINAIGEGVRLSGITLPTGFPTNGTFRVTGFQIRATVTKGTSIYTGSMGLTVSTNDGGAAGTEQQVQFTNSSNDMVTVGGVRNLLGYGTTISAGQGLVGLELRIRAYGPPTQFNVEGINSSSTLFDTFGLSPSIEIFYESVFSSGAGDDAEKLNQIVLGAPESTTVQLSFDFDFEGQNTSFTTASNNTSQNSSGILGWAPSNPTGETDMTGWLRGSQCIDSTNNTALLWKPLSNSQTPVLSTSLHCHSWNLARTGTTSNNTGPYGGHVGNGLHDSTRQTEFLYGETSGRGDNIHHITRSPSVKIDEVYDDFVNGDFTQVYLEFYLYSFGPSVGNLYVYSDNSSTSTDGSATLLAKCMHYTGGTFNFQTNTSGVTHSHVLIPTDATSGFTQSSTYGYQSYYQNLPTSIQNSDMTANQSTFNTYWQRIRIPLHGGSIGSDTVSTNMMSSSFQSDVNNHTQHFYFVYQPANSTTLVASAKTEVGNHTPTFTTSLSGHSGFFGDLAIDDVRLIGVSPQTTTIKKVNDVGAQDTAHIIFDFVNLYDD